MLDWKMLVAGVAALVIVALLVADSGTNFFSGVLGRIADFLGSSPFGNLFSTPQETQEAIITLYPENLSLSLDKSNVTLNSISLSSFTGSMHMDFSAKKATLQETGSQLRISTALEQAKVEGLKIPKLLMENVKLDVSSGKYNISSTSGTLEIVNFIGTADIYPSYIILSGNVTRLDRK